MNLSATPLDPNDGTSCEFELNEIVNINVDGDVLYLWGNVPLILSSVTSPELTAAQTRITKLETALGEMLNHHYVNDGWLPVDVYEKCTDVLLEVKP